MGLIRKSLSVGTVGVVRGSSKKQRNAKAQLAELRKQTEYVRQAAQQQVPQPMAVQPGWYPDPQTYGVLRRWDGWQWTAHTQVPPHAHP